MSGEMGSPGGVGIVLIAVGGALVMHNWVTGLGSHVSVFLMGLSLMAFGVSMIRSDRRGRH